MNPTNVVAMVTLCLMLCPSVLAAQWPQPRTAMDAYDFVQQRRARAETLWTAKDPAGVDLLLETLPYLDEPLVRDLSAGNAYLAARRLNIYMDLSEAFALLGKTTDSPRTFSVYAGRSYSASTAVTLSLVPRASARSTSAPHR